MVGISDPKSAYYRTDRFQRLISRISLNNMGKIVCNQDQTRYWLKVPKVDCISRAYDILLALKGPEGQ